ncbi:hypothetical protein [Endozoicomonas arenosclerae]|uniref:hypothetical protein n=1 Tax=Endozoicomonas arenosclerae TaxID=1633495 RepID=UPI0007851256|nr:hypothetical protein [Endozoicomonas arenosclerae]
MDQIPPSGSSSQPVNNHNQKRHQRRGKHPRHGEVTAQQPKSQLKTIPEEIEDTDSAYSSSSEPGSPIHSSRVNSDNLSARSTKPKLKESWERIVNFINARLASSEYPEPLIHKAREHMEKNNELGLVKCLNQLGLQDRFEALKLLRYQSPDIKVRPELLARMDEMMVTAFIDHFVQENASELPTIYYEMIKKPGSMQEHMARHNLTPENPSPMAYGLCRYN